MVMSMTPLRSQNVGFVAAFSLLLLAGCGKEPVRVYEAPADKPVEGGLSAAPSAPASQPTGMADMPVAVGTGRRLAWEAPAQWKPGRVSSMRVGSFAVGGGEGSAPADLAITTFPGDVGGDLANVNRWRGQVGLGPLAALDASVEELAIAGLPGKLVLMDGPGGSTLSAWVRVGDSTWFFKLTGARDIVAAERETFLAFMGTVKLGAEEGR